MAELGRSGSDIEIPCEDGVLRAYCGVPARGRGRGVLVLHDAEGLDGSARDACDRLARAGFVALVPDWSEAGAAALDSGVRALLSHDATDGARLAALGFGAGGALALEAAFAQPRLGGIVDFGGLPSAEPPRPAPSHEASVLLVFGAEDERVTSGAVGELEARLTRGGLRARLQLVPGVGADYLEPSRADRYEARAAAESWDAALAFLGAVA